jgi:NADH-quinone oxidoreductase subunit L
MDLHYVWLAIAFPLLGALVNGLFGRAIKSKLVSGIIGCGALAGSFTVAVLTYLAYRQSHAAPNDDPFVGVMLWPWIHSGGLNLDVQLLLDPLSITFLLFITGISFLIHLYSTAYMSHDEGYSRFFTYLNLFVAMMLILVLGGNLVLTFVGWEGVGLCSYLLIGFWYRNMYNANCGMKAFIVNRIGDFGVLVAIFLIHRYMGTLVLQDLVQHAAGKLSGGEIQPWVPVAIGLCLFLGACGKSAQFPLHIWLPDAMAGPTPVSALIHAATMVTAGVYMLVRLNPVFHAGAALVDFGNGHGILLPPPSLIVALIGTLTAFMAATIALTQNDIKKVLAYSTVSQLGFMFVAVGVGAYWVAIFHVVTHAFFKACLFLGSGSVIHAMHEEQDTRYMGGLARYMPLTYWTFVISTLAIAGIPPLAGFFSKDEILWQTASWNQFAPLPAILYLVLLLTAFMTAFYMGRVTFKTFLGAPRWTEKFRNAAAHGHGHDAAAHSHADAAHGHSHDAHGDAGADHDHAAQPPAAVQHAPAAHASGGNTPHESSPAMTTPLVVLAFFAVVIGAFLFTPHWLGGRTVLKDWLKPSVGLLAANSPSGEIAAESGGAGEAEHAEQPFIVLGTVEGTEIALAALSVALAAFALFGLARPLFTTGLARTEAWRQRYPKLWAFSYNKWYIDEFFHHAIVIPGTALAYSAWKFFDVKVIDGIVNGVAWVTGGLGHLVRPLQTGFVRNYALYLLAGVVIYMVVSVIR